VEDSARPGDDNYSGNGKKSAGGQDDEPEGLEEGIETPPAEHSTEDGQSSQVNFFA